MRKTRPEDFDPNYRKTAQTGPEPEEVNMDGVVPIKPRNSTKPSPTPKAEPKDDNVVSRHRDTMTPRYHDTVIPRHHDTTAPAAEDATDAVRQAVKEIGKEAATHRFTVAEKRAVAEIIFAYSKKGIKTSENEIARIAINYLIEDYKRRGDDSVLAEVLSKLNS